MILKTSWQAETRRKNAIKPMREENIHDVIRDAVSLRVALGLALQYVFSDPRSPGPLLILYAAGLGYGLKSTSAASVM